MKSIKFDYQKTLIALLVLGCLVSSAASAFGLLILLAYQLAERFLTSNISDKDRAELQTVKAELSKIKVAQEAAGLSKAFGPR